MFAWNEYDENLLRLLYMSCWAALFFVMGFKVYSKGFVFKVLSAFVFLVSAFVYVIYMRGVFLGLLSCLSYVVYLYWLSRGRG